MSPPDPKPPRPRAPSRPDLPIAEVDRTVGGATDQRRFDQPKRSTLTNLPAVTASGEHAATVPAPRLDAPTARPTPPAGLVAQSPDAAVLEALRRRAEAAEAELVRRDRVRAEAESPAAAFPPPVSAAPSPRRPSPAPASSGGLRIEGPGGWKLSVPQAAMVALLAAAGIGGGVTAVAKPAADPAKTDALLAAQAAMAADVALVREQLAGVLKREAARDAYVRCLEESLDEIGEQLLPAQDRVGSAAPLRAYVKRCQRLRP